MTNSINDIDDWEQQIEVKLRADFPQEIEAFEDALRCLGDCVRPNLLGKPELVKKLVSENYTDLDVETLGFLGSWILLSEALVRLEAARRLFLSGYLSRAVASTRDSLESLMVADILRIDGLRVKRWIKGKQIKVTPKYQYHPILNWKIWEKAQAIMNPLGTHSYMEATFLSAVPQLAFAFPNNDDFQRMYQHDVLYVLWRILLRCMQMLLYIKDVYPDAKSKVTEFDEIVRRIRRVSEKQLQISLDELLIINRLGLESL